MYRLILILSLINLNIFVLTQTVFTSPTLSKKNGQSNYLEFAGKTYYFGTVFKTNFYRAMQFCRQQGMQLASIGSQAENDRLGRFVIELGVQHRYFWLSGTNLVGDDQWIWLSSGANMVYTNWYPGEPSGKGGDGTSENCMEFREWESMRFAWNDLNCTLHQHHFICEKSNDCNKK